MEEDNAEEKEPIPTDVGLRHLHKCEYDVTTASRAVDKLGAVLDSNDDSAIENHDVLLTK